MKSGSSFFFPALLARGEVREVVTLMVELRGMSRGFNSVVFCREKRGSFLDLEGRSKNQLGEESECSPEPEVTTKICLGDEFNHTTRPLPSCHQD